MNDYTPTPDFYNDYIAHYNHFHDPRNGQFASKSGGSFIKKNVKAFKKEFKEHPIRSIASISSNQPELMMLFGQLSKKKTAEDIKNNHNDNPNAKGYKRKQIDALKRMQEVEESLKKNKDYQKISKRAGELERQLEEYTVGSKSGQKSEKELNIMSNELKDLLDKRYEIWADAQGFKTKKSK